MAFLVGGANSLTGGYDIDNSCRFNDDDSAQLNITPSAGNRERWTFSCWVKRGNIPISGATALLGAYTSSSVRDVIRFTPDDELSLQVVGSGFTTVQKTTNAIFGDPSAWYHIVVVWDSANGTAGHRTRMYVNGVEHTLTGTDSVSGVDSTINNGAIQYVGARSSDGSTELFWDGYMSEVCFIDGTVYDADDFGEADEDSGIWKPKNVSGLTFGTNGFYLEFKQTGTGTAGTTTIGADTSGNTNHLTSTNLAATDITVDTPTNNFCTMNSLDKDEVTVAEGNTETLLAGSDYNGIRGTIAIPNSGKWYYEVKVITLDDDDHSYVGFADGNTDLDAIFADVAGTVTYVYDNSAGTSDVYNGSADVFTGNSTFDAAANDILNVAFDRDNDKVYFGLNGTYAKADGTTGGDPSNGTDATCTSVAENTAYTFLPAFGGGDSNAKVQFNFGNPPYANSSSVADAAGYGAFEYAPPTGFYALCTKNLAEYG